MRSLGIFLFLSLLVHLISYTGFNLIDLPLAKNQLTTMTEIEVLDDAQSEKKGADEKQIVKQLDSANSLLATAEARFSSEKTQRVERETKVREIGPTQNRSAAAANNFPEKKLTATDGDLPEFTKSIHSKTNLNERSQLGNDLPDDIQDSETTNLNTDSNIYYSFYDRVEQLFRVRWSERINYYWSRIPNDFKKENLAGRVWSTTFEVVLKSSGEYFSATIIRSSGYKPFDEAAIYAFKNARYFPNVPRAKVEADGFVRLKYRFNLHIGPYL